MMHTEDTERLITEIECSRLYCIWSAVTMMLTRKESDRGKDRRKRRSYAIILSYTFSQSGAAISPSASLWSVTVSSPPPQANISAPPFPVLRSFPSPLIMLSLPEPVPTRISP
jgi:hypothetical protein